VDGADANDLTSATRNFWAHTATFEFSNRFTRTQKLAREIHAYDLVPLRQGHLINRRVLLQTGVVDQNIDGAEFLRTASNILATSSSFETSALKAIAV